MQPHDIDVVMGKNLRGLRAVHGFSQAELGAKCEDGLSAQQISKYEQGKDSMSCLRLVEFAKILRYEITDFFSGAKTHA